MGDLMNGESWAERAMAEAEKTGGALELGICLTTNGLVKRQQEDLKEAVDYLEQATVLLKEADARRELVLAHFHLAGVYFSLKKKRLALDYLEIRRQSCRRAGLRPLPGGRGGPQPLLVQYAAANKIADGYYTRMLKLIKTPQTASNPETATAEARRRSRARKACAPTASATCAS